MFDPETLARPNVRNLKPYASARDEFSGDAQIWLDANESPFENGLNRYPDPHQRELKAAIAKLKSVSPEQIFLGNGSDEAIDLLVRAFCEPRQDAIITLPPTYGMYGVCAAINDVETIEVPLTPDFQIDMPSLLPELLNDQAKLIFLCSPNNPSGNLLRSEDILQVLELFQGIVVVDEAYIDFAEAESSTRILDEFPNLVVLQTFSKAWGMAGLRLGMAFANRDIIRILNRIKPPYNINTLTQKAVLENLTKQKSVTENIAKIVSEKYRLIEALKQKPGCLEIFPSDANFVLARFQNADGLYKRLCAKGIVVRNRSGVVPDALRITVGTKRENENLMNCLIRK